MRNVGEQSQTVTGRATRGGLKSDKDLSNECYEKYNKLLSSHNGKTTICWVIDGPEEAEGLLVAVGGARRRITEDLTKEVGHEELQMDGFGAAGAELHGAGREL